MTPQISLAMAEAQALATCSKFPTSTSLDDLIEPFRTNCYAFIARLQHDGARVSIAATYRPPERAYLMHFCCMIADSKQDPATVPSMAGVEIQWDYGDAEISRAAAAAMKRGYGIAYPAAIESRHTQRRAIDMTITGHPLSGHAIWDLGAQYSVIKLPSDPPHWSDDGH